MDAAISEYIDLRLNDPKWTRRLKRKWENVIGGSSQGSDRATSGYGDNVFTNEVRHFFGSKFVKSFACACGETATQRCHGTSRPELVKSAFQHVERDGIAQMHEWILRFFEEHKNSGFTFKCKRCHAAETRSNARAARCH